MLFTSIFTSIMSVIVSSIILLMSRYKSSTSRKEVDEELFHQIYKITIVGSAENTFSIIKKLATMLNLNKIATDMSIVINSAMSITLRNESSDYEEERVALKKVVISTIFLEEKLKKIYRTYSIFIGGGVVTLLYNIYFRDVLFISTLILLSVILVSIYHFVVIFRVRNGLFGTNLYEAKELIEFLEKNSDKFDDNGNGLFNEEKLTNYIFTVKQMQEAGKERLNELWLGQDNRSII